MNAFYDGENANEDEVNGWMFNERLLNEKDLLTRALT